MAVSIHERLIKNLVAPVIHVLSGILVCDYDDTHRQPMPPSFALALLSDHLLHLSLPDEIRGDTEIRSL